MNCTNCNAVLPENAAFCPNCGTPINPKHSFCSICGKAFREGENTCSVCESMNEEQKGQTTACTVATSPYRKLAKIAVIVILCLLFICSVGIRFLFGVVSFWTVLISIVGLIIQLFRGKPLKKFALALGCAVLVVVAAVLLDLLLVYLPVQVEDDMGTQIVGEWEALHSTVNGEVIYLSSGESITLTAKKNGKPEPPSKLMPIKIWRYIKDKEQFFTTANILFNTISLLTVNLLVLIISTTLVYISIHEITILGQNVVTLSFYFCTNTMIELFLDILKPLSEEKKRLLDDTRVTDADIGFINEIDEYTKKLLAAMEWIEKSDNFNQEQKQRAFSVLLDTFDRKFKTLGNELGIDSVDGINGKKT